MKISYSLTKDDILKFNNEFRSQKKQWLNFNFRPLRILYVLFGLTVLSLCIYLISDSIYISSIFFIFFLSLMFIFFKMPLRLYSPINDKYYTEISINDENINIYFKNKVISLLNSQIKNLYETEHYFLIPVTECLPHSILIPKNAIENPQELKLILKKERKVQNYNLNILLYLYIGIILMNFFSALNYSNNKGIENTNPKCAGIHVEMLPVITYVDENSKAEETGLQRGDIIHKLNGSYYWKFKYPKQVYRNILKNKKIDITIRVLNKDDIKERYYFIIP